MPKNSPIVDILSEHPPTGAGASHNSPRPGPPWHSAPVERLGPLAFGAAGHRWGAQGEQNSDTAAPVQQLHRQRWCPGASMARSPVGWRSDVFSGWGLGKTFGFWDRLRWSIFEGTLGGNWLNLVSRTRWCQCIRRLINQLPSAVEFPVYEIKVPKLSKIQPCKYKLRVWLDMDKLW